jgi:hypothetical protein
MRTKGIRRRQRDEYRYAGFYPNRYVEEAKWDHDARVIRLTRRSKKRNAESVAEFNEVGTTARDTEYETCHAPVFESFWSLNFAECNAKRVAW